MEGQENYRDDTGYCGTMYIAYEKCAKVFKMLNQQSNNSLTTEQCVDSLDVTERLFFEKGLDSQTSAHASAVCTIACQMESKDIKMTYNKFSKHVCPLFMDTYETE